MKLIDLILKTISFVAEQEVSIADRITVIEELLKLANTDPTPVHEKGDV